MTQVDYNEQAGKLIEEYEDALMSGKNPRIEDFVKQYKGKNKAEFEEELVLAGRLTVAGMKERHEEGKLAEITELSRLFP